MSLIPFATPSPTEAPRKRPATVLDEDLYVDAVSDIIKRDFFPDLDALRYKNQYLDAAVTGDIASLREATFGLAQLTGAAGQPGDRTPLSHEMLRGRGGPGGATPSLLGPSLLDNSDLASLVGSEGELVNTDLRLDGFQTKYTSEDNASFTSVIEKQNEAKRQKYSWAFDPERKQLLLQNGEETEARKLIEGSPGAQGASTTGSELVLASNSSEDDPKKRDFWKFRTKNELFYYPTGIEGQSLLTDRGPDKEITLGNTRFPKTVASAEAEADEREKTKEVWRAMAAATPGLFAGGMTPSSSSGATPRVGGHAFVPSTPTINPGVDIDPLMTWGMIESTPLLISGSGDVEGAPSFKLPPTPRRDVIAHEMGKSAAKSLRQRVSNNSKSVIRKAQSPAIGTPADRARLLSPAARTFMQKNRLGTPVMSPLQQAARTPFGGTPRGARDATPRAGMGVRQDPKISGGASAAGGKAAEDSSITDHLLDLGGRR